MWGQWASESRFECNEMFEMRRGDTEMIQFRVSRKIMGRHLLCGSLWENHSLLRNTHTHIEKYENAALPDYCRPGRRSAGW